MTSTPTRPVDNVVIATKGLQDRNTNIIAGTTVENKGKLILTGLESQKQRVNGVVTRPRFTGPNRWRKYRVTVSQAEDLVSIPVKVD